MMLSSLLAARQQAVLLRHCRGGVVASALPAAFIYYEPPAIISTRKLVQHQTALFASTKSGGGKTKVSTRRQLATTAAAAADVILVEEDLSAAALLAAAVVDESKATKKKKARKKAPSKRKKKKETTEANGLEINTELPSATTSSCIDSDNLNSSTAEPDLLNPSDMGPIPFPKSLSPSSIAEFQKCPQSFLFRYLYGLKSPKNKALAKGSVCHSALEQLFDLKPQDRTLANLQNLFRKEWSNERLKPHYRHLFDTDVPPEGAVQLKDDNDTESKDDSLVDSPYRNLDDEAAWGMEAMQLLENYMRQEDPQRIQPAQRELWLQTKLPIDAAQGATGYMATTDTEEEMRGDDALEMLSSLSSEKNNDDPANNKNKTHHVLVRGIVDRLDLVRVSTGGVEHRTSSSSSSSEIVLRVVDYKTGAAPNLEAYPPHTQQRIRDENFFQLLLYALLLRENNNVSNLSHHSSSGSSLSVRFVRLFHLASAAEPQRARFLDLDLGASQEARDALLQKVHQQVSQVYKDICELVATQDPKAFKGCNGRPYCSCHEFRAKFEPGTVWEPEEDSTAEGGGGGSSSSINELQP